MGKGFQRSESIPIGILLALTGGYLDAYTYFSRGGVFSNAQTGNIVLLGINLSEGDWEMALVHLVSVIAFAAGVLLADWIKLTCKTKLGLHWRQRTIGIEFVILILVGFVPNGSLNPYINMAVSFVCAMQVESFRKVHDLAYATTMCTGNLRSGTENLFQYLRSGEKKRLQNSLKYYSIILMFMIGAFLGCLLTKIFWEKAVWGSCIFLFVAFLLMYEKKEKGR